MKPLSNKTGPLWDDSKEEWSSCKRSNRQQAKRDIEELINTMNDYDNEWYEDYEGDICTKA